MKSGRLALCKHNGCNLMERSLAVICGQLNMVTGCGHSDAISGHSDGEVGVNVRKDGRHFVQKTVSREQQTCETLRRQPDFSVRQGYMGTVASRV